MSSVSTITLYKTKRPNDARKRRVKDPKAIILADDKMQEAQSTTDTTTEVICNWCYSYFIALSTYKDPLPMLLEQDRRSSHMIWIQQLDDWIVPVLTINQMIDNNTFVPDLNKRTKYTTQPKLIADKTFGIDFNPMLPQSLVKLNSTTYALKIKVDSSINGSTWDTDKWADHATITVVCFHYAHLRHSQNIINQHESPTRRSGPTQH